VSQAASVSQQDFAAALRVPALSIPAGLGVGGRQDAERRFAVHRNNFVVTLIDALAESFPVTQALVGTAFFRAMARERVLAAPPRSPVLVDYAIDFPEFIALFPPAASVPYLADVARIEALRIQAYHAADATPLPEAAYRALLAAPERLAVARLDLHPACRWFHSRHAAYSIWQAHQGLQDLSAARLENLDVARPEDVLIARPSLDVITTGLPEGAIALLDALANGEPLVLACQAAHAANEGADDSALFTTLIRYGLVAGLDPVLENGCEHPHHDCP
jgi:hypothetical protein